jgi:ATP-dependent exoDNAse (exonuclease V) beta subunit
MSMSDGFQMDMFEDVSAKPRLATKIVWSYSRRQVLEQCPRRYYYQYYTSPAAQAMGNSLGETLKFARALKNRHIWAGEILHSTISRFLQEIQKGKEQNLQSVLSQVQRRYSAGPLRSSASQQGKECRGLLEFYYDFSDAETLLAESGKRLLVAVNNFFSSSNFVPFVNAAAQPEARIEERIEPSINHFNALGRIDLAYPQGNKIVIVDWKLGGPGNADEILQLSCYALWAIEEYRCLPQDIHMYTAHLSDDLVMPILISENILRQTKARILQDLERMQMLNEYGKNALEGAFPRCSLSLVCTLCPFQVVCLKEL